MRKLFEEYYSSLHRVLRKEGKSKYSFIVGRDMAERLFPSDVSDFEGFVSGMHVMIVDRLQMVNTMETTRNRDNIKFKIRGCVLCPLNVQLCERGIEPGCIIPSLLFTGLKKTFKEGFYISARTVYFEKTDENDCDWVFNVILNPKRKHDKK